MVALRLFSLLLAITFASTVRAAVFPYEAVGQGGPNNLIDSNAESCDNSPYNPGTGTWSGPGEGCYNRKGAKCSLDQNHMCDLQIVPAGRCTYGDDSATGGPGGSNTCLWPHGGGHCSGDVHVGCVPDGYVGGSGTPASGPSGMCASAGGTCDTSSDPYGGPFRDDCTCTGSDSTAANFETAICGGASATTRAVCSDGDPDRDTGGYGTALGVEIDLGGGTFEFANMGPAIVGVNQAVSSPPYGIENLPQNDAFDPQRQPGTVQRPTFPGGTIVKVRVTDARDFDTSFLPAVTKITAFGDSYWSDWAFASKSVAGLFNTHIVTWACDPPVGYQTSDKIDPTPTLPNSGDEGFCSQLGRPSYLLQWKRDLNATELASTNCPPNCKKDFDITTTELEQFNDVGLKDVAAGAQLAIQSGEGRTVGKGDAIGVAVVTSISWLNANDMRCKIGGWDPTGTLPAGRCSDGPDQCVLGASGTCVGEGGACRACIGPFNASTNPRGLPIGYNTHGLADLDLVANHRIGGIAGSVSIVKVPLFVVATTGYAGSDFRDNLAGTGALDHSDMGAVVAGPFDVGVGTGGTFTNGSPLLIGGTCCATGTDIPWKQDAVGTAAPGAGFNRTFDRGPGPDGIPGCSGDVTTLGNGLEACNQRLHKGAAGDKLDGFNATGKDDVPTTYPLAAGNVPASTSRYKVRDATPAVVAYFTGLGYTSPNPTSVNTVAAFTYRDIDVFGTDNTDILVKVNGSECPIVNGAAACSPAIDTDLDGVEDQSDNCPTIANSNQADGDGDGVGDACDNCIFVPNPRVDMSLLTAGAASNTNLVWATTTGQQRDDDHDGFGNKCDADFTPAGLNVGIGDTGQFNASFGKSRLIDTCGTGTLGNRPCAIFDLDEASALNIGLGDKARFLALFGLPAGGHSPANSGKCAACPFSCVAGSAGQC